MIFRMVSPLEELSQSDIFQRVGAICAVVNDTIKTEDLLELSLSKTMDLFGAIRGSIFILDENGETLMLKAASGMQIREQKEMVKRMGEGIVGQVAKFKKPIFVDDINLDKRFKKYKSNGNYRTPSFICAPLIIKDQLIGVINVSDKQSGHRFKEHDMQLLDFLASQIALNYKRIELYEKFKSIIKEKETLKNELGQSGQEKEYLQKKVTIQEKFATIGKLAGGIAHEFNNPLDGVMRYTNLCIEHIQDDEVVHGYLIEIKQGLKRMANIVKNLLACSRNDFPVNQRVDIRHVLEHIHLSFNQEFAIKKIIFTKNIQPDISGMLDLGMERILTNLIRNSIDAIDKEGEIVVDVKKNNGMLMINVSDTGIGIANDQIDQIFEPFYTTKDIDKGCGLGLTIVSEIVKSYDGKISVQSRLGKGTTFMIVLPTKD